MLKAERTSECRRRIDLRALLPALILILVWVLFSWRFLTPKKRDRVAFPVGDFTHNFYVYRTLAFRELSAGRYPLWEDCVYAGYPFQADPQSALFYPPALADLAIHLLLGLKEFHLYGLQLEALLHLLLASALTYTFLRGEVRSRLAALLGAVVFAYGGYLTSYPLLQLAIGESAVWLPLALWGARGLARVAGRRHYLAMVVGLSMSFLAGHPQTFVHVVYATLAYYGYRAWRQGVPAGRAFGRLALVGAFAGGLCAVQLLPTFQLMQLSTRAKYSFGNAGTGLALQDVVQLVLPGIVTYWQPLYVGIFPLILAGFAALAGDRGQDRAFWLGLGVVALVLSFGKKVFAFDLPYLLVPGYSLFQSQERHAFLFSFALSVLAAYGADLFFSPLARVRRETLRSIARLVARSLSVAFLLLVLVAILSEAGIGDFTHRSVAKRLASLCLVLASTAALLYGRLARPRLRLALAGLALVAIVVDLFTLNRPLNYAKPCDPFPPQPALAHAVADDLPFFRIKDDRRLPGHTACMNGLLDVRGMLPLMPEKVKQFTKRVPEEVRWNLLGVRYLITWRETLAGSDGTPVSSEQLYHEGEPPNQVYTHRLPYEPRLAWIVHDIWVVEGDKTRLARLGNPDFEPHRIAVVGNDLPAVSPAAGGPEEVTVIERTPTRTRLQASLSSAGLLLLSQASYPGWQVAVNGAPAPLLEADGLLPAVVLPAGDVEVTFRYRPMTFYVGLTISVVTFVVALAALVVPSRTPWGKKKV